MKSGRVAALLSVAFLTAGLVAGCSNSLNQADVQSKLSQGMNEQLGGDFTVTCPSDIAVAAGATFTCSTSGADGSTGTIAVTQDDDQGNLSWEYTAN